MVYSFSFKIITISNSFQFKISIQIILFYARIFLLKSNIPCGSISKINIQIVLYSIKIFFSYKINILRGSVSKNNFQIVLDTHRKCFT